MFYPCRQLQPCFVGFFPYLLAREGPAWVAGVHSPGEDICATPPWCGHGSWAAVGGPTAGVGWGGAASTPLSLLCHRERCFPSQETFLFSFLLVCCVYLDMLEDLHPFPTSVCLSVPLCLMLLQKIYQQLRDLSLWGGESWWAPTAEMTAVRWAGLGDAVICSCSAAVGPWLSPFASLCPSFPVLPPIYLDSEWLRAGPVFSWQFVYIQWLT